MCIDQICAIHVDDCHKYATLLQNNCNMKAYVAWYGTDANKRHLVSLGYLPIYMKKDPTDYNHQARVKIDYQNIF